MTNAQLLQDALDILLSWRPSSQFVEQNPNFDGFHAELRCAIYEATQRVREWSNNVQLIEALLIVLEDFINLRRSHSSRENEEQFSKLRTLQKLKQEQSIEHAIKTFRVSKTKCKQKIVLDILRRTTSKEHSQSQRIAQEALQSSIADVVPNFDESWDLSCSLYHSLKKDLHCDCAESHELSLHIGVPQTPEEQPRCRCIQTFLSFDHHGKLAWQEARFLVPSTHRPQSVTFSESTTPKKSVDGDCNLNYCHMIKMSWQGRSCFQVLLDQQSYGPSRSIPKTYDDKMYPQDISLSTFFKDCKGTPTLQGRQSLAVMFSRSLLRLLDDPFVGEALALHRIHFFHPMMADIPRIVQPFLAIGPVNREAPAKPALHHHPIPSVLRLGILLCELHFGQPITKWRDEGAADLPDDDPDYYAGICALQEMEREIFRDGGQQYYSSTAACFTCSFLPEDWSSSSSCGSRVVQAGFYKSVVQPLEDEYKKRWRMSLEELQDRGSAANERCWGFRALSLMKQLARTPRAHQSADTVRREDSQERIHSYVINPNNELSNHAFGGSPDTHAFFTPVQRYDLFEIAIICALPEEFDAVRALFDEDYNNVELNDENPNIYKAGKIGKYLVVLTLMPGMGKKEAASAAAHLGRSFTKIRLGLVVGVCAGTPKDQNGNDILLGDVIISTAIIQYDFGCEYEDKFVRRDTITDNLPRPNPKIRSFLRDFETDHEAIQLRNSTVNHLNKLLEKETQASWRYPGPQNDRLFQDGYLHQHVGADKCDACIKNPSLCDVANKAQEMDCDSLGCDPEKLMHRPRLEEINYATSAAPMPVVHLGLIASGDRVIKSSSFRQNLLKEQIIGFDMEAAGAWDQFPTIVIKGVCDYGDSHKNKRWQRYASATAASCMKAILEKWRFGSRSQTTQVDVPSDQSR